ncbi:MAG TPA: peptidoglycan editing factor PgeF [Candidatus Dormibacteraeota bacterium]
MGDLIQHPALAAQPRLIHAFSTLALGSMRRTAESLVTPERAALLAQLGLDAGRLSVAGAVHGADVARIDEAQGAVEGVDALVTDQPGLPLLATFADCYPVVLYDPVRVAVGLAHAGWRGTRAGVAANTVAALSREYGSRPEDLVAGIGPGICGRCYEVGKEVATQFADGVVRPGAGTGKYLLDLAEANRRQLLEAGLDPAHVHVLDACTKESPELPSHRRRPDGIRAACVVALR